MKINIVEYDRSYAAKVADMWTRSGDSWGGFNAEFTEESIAKEEEQSVYVNLFLAVVNDEVVGYSKLAKWTEEEGGLYVELLNVRPDMHGKKIGKTLMLRTVERTIELGWSRLDLHTWAGNTKAVPLYKKTGFFWEERDQEVYLVNFIPAVVKNPFLTDFFKKADWYKDSTRPIEVVPDGIKENGFTYFTYSWEKDGEEVQVQYARRGRGLRALETKDLKIESSIPEAKLVFGRSYPVEYRIENKGDKPLDISLKGIDDKNITFSFEHSQQVKDSAIITGMFTVGNISKNQDDWKTHPKVRANITVNGKSCDFETGIVPQFPVDIQMAGLNNLAPDIKEQRVYLNLENNMDEKVTVTAVLPETDNFKTIEKSYSAEMAPKSRKSIEVIAEVILPTIYDGEVRITAAPGNETIEYSKRLSMRFPGLTGVYSGEETINGSSFTTIGAGPYALFYCTEERSFINWTSMKYHVFGFEYAKFHTPKLGKPVSDEFIHQKPDSVDVRELPGGMAMDAVLISKDFPGVTVIVHHHLESSGVAKRWFEIKNNGDKPLDSGMILVDSINMWMAETAYAKNDGSGIRIVETPNDLPQGFLHIKDSEVAENWLFSRGESFTLGLIWDESAKPVISDWMFSVEHSIGGVQPGESCSTTPLTVYQNIFLYWNQCREWALKEQGMPNLKLPLNVEPVNTLLTDDNPFRKGAEAVLKTREERASFLNGTVRISSSADSSVNAEATAEQEQKLRVLKQSVTTGSLPVTPVDITYDFNPIGIKRKMVFFQQGEHPVETSASTEEGQQVYTASNGLLTIKAGEKYGPVLYSCSVNGTEWLGHQFPNPGPKDWWNPWLGGVQTSPITLEFGVLLKEAWNIRFQSIEDTVGNRWEGIEIETSFSEHKELKGLSSVQRFMLLPGIPVLMHHTIVNLTYGRYEPGVKWDTQYWVGDGKTTEEVTLHYQNRNNQDVRLRSGLEEVWNDPRKIPTISNGTGTVLTPYTDRRKTEYTVITNKQSTLVSIKENVFGKEGTCVSLVPRFFIYSEEGFPQEMLYNLNSVRIDP